VPSLASSDVTIDCTVGTATASGTAAKLDVAVNASVGTATANGTAASLDVAVNATVGTATANGIAASIDTSGSTTIDCAVGTATANGTRAALDEQIACSVGTATANGVVCTFVSALIVIDTHDGFAHDDKWRKPTQDREELRAQIIWAVRGPQSDEVKEIIAPYIADRATRRGKAIALEKRIDFASLYEDLEAIERFQTLMERNQEDELIVSMLLQ